ASVEAALYRAWKEPSGFPPQTQCEVRFDITASGRLLNPLITSTSGDSDFDASALRAVRDTRGLGPTPDGRSRSYSFIFNLK
ncbi:MAG: TonB C-terminal domain-containing protein, partial [Opitutaceae bacterium]|nr:TonB C-terminal domain-containing protein [Opitutaceae bacterium]